MRRWLERRLDKISLYPSTPPLTSNSMPLKGHQRTKNKKNPDCRNGKTKVVAEVSTQGRDDNPPADFFLGVTPEVNHTTNTQFNGWKQTIQDLCKT